MSAMFETEGHLCDEMTDSIGREYTVALAFSYADAANFYENFILESGIVAQGTGMNKGSPVKIRHRRATVMYDKVLPIRHC